MADKIKINTAVLKNYIAQYKATFEQHRFGENQEIFKWQAVKCFQDNWNIDADDFIAMLKASLAKTFNLLSSAQFFPRKMIEFFAEKDPETVRAMFRTLFDESRDVASRVEDFIVSSDKLIAIYMEGKMSYQNPNSISTYLWLHNPDKYYIYKYSEVKANAKKLCNLDMPAGKLDRMTFAFQFYDAICEELGRDAELIELSKRSLTTDCWPDEALKTLTIDIAFFISRHEPDVIVPLAQGEKYLMPKNIILYGSPGTGKTYSSIQYAVAIIEEKSLEVIRAEAYEDVFARYLAYKEQSLVAFTTFHQSYGYEEFIEGIRPVLVSGDEGKDEASDIQYELHDGIFKDFCDKAGIPASTGIDPNLGIGKNPTVWKVSLEGTGENPTRDDCMSKNHIRIGWDGYGENISDRTDYSEYGGSNVLNAFYNKMQLGDIVFSCYSGWTIDAIGVISGSPEWHGEYEHYKRVRPVRWLAKGLDINIVELNGGKTMTLSTIYKLSVSATDAIQLLREVSPELFTPKVKIPNRVFIIDEINRGNISKIFGELITLLEPSKRIGAPEQLRAALPYSGQIFGVPQNVYIIGTMNTADRSIALMDTALRRRFDFVEMQPDSGLLQDVVVDGIDIAEMLDTLNKRITVLLDREHTIGHSYFLPLKDEPTLKNLAQIFEKKIIPLLQEYFYDDYEKIQLVLGDNQKSEDRVKFIIKKTDAAKLFGDNNFDFGEYYIINSEAFREIEAYAHLY